MSENSKIEWCDHTFNPWVGCAKVSPACDYCYAETWAKRTGQAHLWNGERRRTSLANWKQPIKWNAQHERFYAEHGRRQRIFCASLADVFDNQVQEKWRHDLFGLIASTPNLDWLLLTKRPQNVSRMTNPHWSGWKNVWLGTTVENQQEAERRIPLLLQTPAAVRFLSCEPLLGPVELRKWMPLSNREAHEEAAGMALDPMFFALNGIDPLAKPKSPIDWVIVGGESGPGARPMHPDWARSLRDQCQDAGVSFFFKQWGEWLPFVHLGHGMAVAQNDLTDVDWNRQSILFDDQNEIGAIRVGKYKAGRMLDGREWNEFPGG